jgi:hypothetical protein
MAKRLGQRADYCIGLMAQLSYGPMDINGGFNMENGTG